ncbi:MAG TPA: hypothetical protein VHR45_14065 [Thermoanaerobaculia bacterium]|nr:hypothetical protein [Thermoanaerobaculia bacterium]
MNKNTISRPILFLYAAGLSLVFLPAPLRGAPSQTVEPSVREYAIGRTGEISSLGIEVQVTPQVNERHSITGFMVRLSYRDPSYPTSGPVSFLQPTFFPSSCEPFRRTQDRGPYIWFNSRGTRFAVTLHQGCKDTVLMAPVPYLEATINCARTADELRYLDVVASGRIFEIIPTGFRHTELNDVGRLLEVGREAYSIFSEVATVLVLLDLIAVSEGTLSVGGFVMRAVAGTVSGYLRDKVVNAGIDYVESNVGLRVEFKLTGWDMLCRLCGYRFHLNSLKDGDLVRCPRSGCNGEAYVHFP